MGKTHIIVYIIFPLSYPILRKESFGAIQMMFSFTNFKMVNTISISKVFRVCFCPFTLAVFSQSFFLIFLGNRIIMIHNVGLLDAASKINRIATLCSAAGASFIIFLWLLCDVLFGVFLKYFTLLRGLYGAMQQA